MSCCLLKKKGCYSARSQTVLPCDQSQFHMFSTAATTKTMKWQSWIMMNPLASDPGSGSQQFGAFSGWNLLQQVATGICASMCNVLAIYLATMVSHSHDLFFRDKHHIVRNPWSILQKFHQMIIHSKRSLEQKHSSSVQHVKGKVFGSAPKRGMTKLFTWLFPHVALHLICSSLVSHFFTSMTRICRMSFSDDVDCSLKERNEHIGAVCSFLA